MWQTRIRGRSTDDELRAVRWPAHLHIDLLPEARGSGVGRQLMARWLDALRADGSCLLPDRGGATIHHVHAEDVADLHLACLEQPEHSVGQSFNSVCTQALTLRGYAELVARHFGHEPRLEFVPWSEFASRVGPEDADLTLDHIGRAPLFSMDKARDLLEFTPKHSVTHTVLEAIDAWVAANRS